MKNTIIFSTLLLLLSCKEEVKYEYPPRSQGIRVIKEKAPRPAVTEWWLQDIDGEPCYIILPPRLQILKAGNKYAATYDMRENWKWWACDRSLYYHDFDVDKNHAKYFDDTCELKAYIKEFIREKMFDALSSQ